MAVRLIIAIGPGCSQRTEDETTVPV